jgi:large repetitive protein
MSNLDVIARRHAEKAHAAVARVRPPMLDPNNFKARPTTVRTNWTQPRWVVAAIAVFVVAIIAMPLLLGSGRKEDPATTVAPATTIPPATTVAPATTVPPPQPASGGFVPAGDLQQGCSWCPGVVLQDGRVLVVGGWPRDGGGNRPAAELFDPESGTFTPTGVPGDDFSHGLGVVLEDGRVLFVFGLSEQAEIYDPVTGEFQPTAITYPQGQGGTAVALAGGNVLLLFGDGTVATYDPAADSLTSVGSVPIPVETATVLDDGSVLVTGSESGGVIEPDVFRYQPVSMLTRRTGHTATKLGGGQVLIAGGGNPEEPFEPISAAELFDPETVSFVATGSLNLPRSLHAAALLEDGRVLIVGGTPGTMIGSRNGPGMAEYDHAEIYDPGSRTFSLVDSPMSQPRIALTVVTLLDGRVLVLGNYAGNFPSANDSSASTSEVFAP